MRCRSAFVVILALSLPIISVTTSTNNPKKILTVGDSWASYSGNTFSKFCNCAVQIQRGIGGTTAVQWASGYGASGDTNFANALTAAGTMNGNDVVVLSVGGNDWMGIGCAGTLAGIQAQVQSAVNALVNNITATGCGNDCPSIHMFGYAMITNGTDGCADNLPAFGVLKTAIANVAAATAQVAYTDITSLCGGTTTSLSPVSPCFGNIYAHDNSSDNIHMNQEGYCMVITQPSVQQAFGCNTQSYTCSSVPKDIYMTARTSETCSAYTSCSSNVNATCTGQVSGASVSSSSSITLMWALALLGVAFQCVSW